MEGERKLNCHSTTSKVRSDYTRTQNERYILFTDSIDDLTLLFISGMLNDGKSRVDAEYTQEKSLHSVHC